MHTYRASHPMNSQLLDAQLDALSAPCIWILFTSFYNPQPLNALKWIILILKSTPQGKIDSIQELPGGQIS